MTDKKYKQPGETLDYDIDCTDWLGEGDYVTAASSVVAPVGLTIISTTVFMTGTRVKVLLSGGTNGTKYKVTTTITTHDGLIKEKEFYMQIKEL